MDIIEILERLISIKNTALQRAVQEAEGKPAEQLEIRAYILQQGMEQLVIEIQNKVFADLMQVRTISTPFFGDAADIEVIEGRNFRMLRHNWTQNKPIARVYTGQTMRLRKNVLKPS